MSINTCSELLAASNNHPRGRIPFPQSQHLPQSFCRVRMIDMSSFLHEFCFQCVQTEARLNYMDILIVSIFS